MDSHFHPIRVVHYGLGAIGTSIARLTAQQRGLQVVGGIERDPAKVGRDLGEVIESYTEVARRLGIMKDMPTVIQGGLH